MSASASASLSASSFPSSAPANALASLPAELLALILSLLPLRPRLLVAARVCRRWRAAAVRTVHSLDMCERSADLLARYPCLTDITLDLERGTPLTLPPTVRSLRVEFDDASSRAPEELPLASYPPALAAFHLAFSPLEPSLPLLYASRTSLTKLSVPLGTSEKERDVLLSTHFPALERLSLRGNAELAWPFILRHQTQLVALKLTVRSPIFGATPLVTDAHTLHFPRVEKLRLRGLITADVRRILHACPRLQRLDLSCTAVQGELLSEPKVQAALCSLLMVLHAPGTVAALAKCPKLRYLGPENAAVSRATLTSLTVLNFHSLAALVAAAPPDTGLPHLMRLTLLHTDAHPPERPLALPRLTQLAFTQASLRFGEAPPRLSVELLVAQLRYLLLCAPRLRSLRLVAHLSHLTRYGVDRFLEFLRDLAARGVEDVDMTRCTVHSQRLVTSAKAHPWMHVRVRLSKRMTSGRNLGAPEEDPEGPPDAWEQQ